MKLIHIPTLCTLAAITLGQAPLHAADKAKTKPANKPVTQALITGTEAGWRPMTKDDFVNVNCHDDVVIRGQPDQVHRQTGRRHPHEKMIKISSWSWSGSTSSGGNSGVFLWATPDSIKRLEEGKGRLPAGIEVQVLDLGYAELYENATKNRPTGSPPRRCFPNPKREDETVPAGRPNGKRSFPSKNTTKGINQWNPLHPRNQRRSAPVGQRRRGLGRHRLPTSHRLPLPRVRGCAHRVPKPANPRTAVRSPAKAAP